MAFQVIVERDAELLEIVAALRCSRSFTGLLHCGEQQRHQDRDDGDNDEQLNQRESATVWRTTIRIGHDFGPSRAVGRNALRAEQPAVKLRFSTQAFCKMLKNCFE
jgi:hypothetical protein